MSPRPTNHTLSKVLGDLEAFLRNFRPFAVADRMRVAWVAHRPNAPASAGAGSFRSIAKGASGHVVEELRIRLAGFGGVLPGALFDDSLEKAVQQFEQDVMKRDPTGIVDKTFAERLDQFAKDWPIHFEKQLKCGCGKCKGFGEGRFKGEYSRKNSKLEMYHKYEYPGIHRSLLWACRAIMHYCAEKYKEEIRFSVFSSGYRCHTDNGKHMSKNKAGVKVPRTTTNHMGKAVDLAFETCVGSVWKGNGLDSVTRYKSCNKVRDLAVEKMKASISWATAGEFGLEPGGPTPSPKSKPSGCVAPTWVHMDVREWQAKHLDDKFFVQSQASLDGDSMVVVGSDSTARPQPSELHFFDSATTAKHPG